MLLRPNATRELPVSGRTVPRAPVEDGAIVASPPLEQVPDLLSHNRGALAAGPSLLGRPWADLRDEARFSAVRAACDYLTEHGEDHPAVSPSRPFIVAGHQPELFHPGVWIKNFALCGLARRHELTPLNLIVDNDAVKVTSIRVPAPPTAEHPWPHLTTVPFDRGAAEAPYEEQTIHDPALFADFAERVGSILRGWSVEPMLPAFWSEVRRRAERDTHLGDALATARRGLERRWGCQNLEVPLSALCRTPSFAWFACHLLAELPRFHALYNERVRTYRRLHGIRSANHPVPDLASDGDWLEAPLWAWSGDHAQARGDHAPTRGAGQPRRARLLARRRADRIELRAGPDTWPALPWSPSSPEATVATWQGLEAQGLKVRSRALTTTLYARLFLGDLFIHGIGGGKYDELTDELMAGFYHITPPEFLILSGTKLLPLPTAPVSADDCRRLAHLLRDVHYNPQRHLADGAGLATLVRRKQEWIERQPATKAERRERFKAIRRLNDELQPPLHDREHELRVELERCEKQEEANSVLRRRDYAFCLYPEAVLRPFCAQFL
jgi:hypothetical protein